MATFYSDHPEFKLTERPLQPGETMADHRWWMMVIPRAGEHPILRHGTFGLHFKAGVSQAEVEQLEKQLGRIVERFSYMDDER